MRGYLTTHVLDIAQGRPASGMTVELWRLTSGGKERQLLKKTQTNAEGRTDAPLLTGHDLTAGVYELVFAVGVYFAAQPVVTVVPPFLDQVPVRFRIADPLAHYHVPLLTSPWAYSTYRGS